MVSKDKEKEEESRKGHSTRRTLCGAFFSGPSPAFPG
jgi:hypothetical protein